MALVAHHAPRGPLLLRASAMRALGFFDEGRHHLGGDDMELEWPRVSRFGWRSAHVYADVHQLAKAHQNKGGGNGAWRRRAAEHVVAPRGRACRRSRRQEEPDAAPLPAARVCFGRRRRRRAELAAHRGADAAVPDRRRPAPRGPRGV